MLSLFFCSSFIGAWKGRWSFSSQSWGYPRFISSSRAFGRRNTWKTSFATRKNQNSMSQKGKKARWRNEGIDEEWEESGGGASAYQVGRAWLLGIKEPRPVRFDFQG